MCWIGSRDPTRRIAGQNTGFQSRVEAWLEAQHYGGMSEANVVLIVGVRLCASYLCLWMGSGRGEGKLVLVDFVCVVG